MSASNERQVTFGQVRDQALACELAVGRVRSFFNVLINGASKESPLVHVMHDNSTMGRVSLFCAEVNTGQENLVVSGEDLKKRKLDLETITEHLDRFRGFFDKTNFVEQPYIQGFGIAPTVWGALSRYRNFATMAKLVNHSVPAPERSMTKPEFDTLLDNCLTTDIHSLQTATGKSPDAQNVAGSKDFITALKGFYIEELDPTVVLAALQHTLEAAEYVGEQENIRLLRNSCMRICKNALVKIQEQQPNKSGRA